MTSELRNALVSRPGPLQQLRRVLHSRKENPLFQIPLFAKIIAFVEFSDVAAILGVCRGWLAAFFHPSMLVWKQLARAGSIDPRLHGRFWRFAARSTMSRERFLYSTDVRSRWILMTERVVDYKSGGTTSSVATETMRRVFRRYMELADAIHESSTAINQLKRMQKELKKCATMKNRFLNSVSSTH